MIDFKKLLIESIGPKIPFRIGIGLSGGVDSMLLTYLFADYKKKHFPEMEIFAITFDHGIRNKSEIESQDIKKIVTKWGVYHTIKKLNYNQEPSLIKNFEEVSRIKRLEQFRIFANELNIQNIFLGHNLDDQLETFMYRLVNNSTLFGLSGLKSKSLLPVNFLSPNEKKIYLCRPMLKLQKKSIIAEATRCNLKWFEDITNKDIHFTKRNLYRQILHNTENVSIPEKCEYSLSNIITKAKILRTYLKIKSANMLLKKKQSLFYSFLVKNSLLFLHYPSGTIKIFLPLKSCYYDQKMLLSRFFFHTLYPFSASKYYHWIYAKIERSFVNQLVDFVQSKKKKSLKLTYFNLLFFMSLSKLDYLSIFISRLPFPLGKAPSYSIILSYSWSNWFLFDNRFWIRGISFAHDPINILIIPYGSKRYPIHPSLNIPELLNHILFGVPAVIINQLIVSLPTFSLYENESTLKFQWLLKKNIYNI